MAVKGKWVHLFVRIWRKCINVNLRNGSNIQENIYPKQSPLTFTVGHPSRIINPAPLKHDIYVTAQNAHSIGVGRGLRTKSKEAISWRVSRYLHLTEINP